MTTTDSRAMFPVVGSLKVLLSVGAIALLLASWGALFWFITLETDLLLPYDTSWYDYWGWPPGSPPAGSWQRSLNYFLESPIGSVLPALLTVGVSASLLGIVLFRALQRQQKPVPLLLGFAVSNLLSVPAMLLASYAVTASLAGGLTGWNGTMILGLPTCLLLVLLFVVQSYVLPRKLLPKWCP